MLVGSDDYLWTLIKAGEGSGSGSGETTSYSWEQMQGVWMGSKYVDCASIIKLYKQQQQLSSAYYNGDFEYTVYSSTVTDNPEKWMHK